MLYSKFIEAGYRIFGLHKIVDGKCSCINDDCKAVGKHPFASSWQHTPKWSESQITRMQESGVLDTGYGVLVYGLLVVDIDARNGGVESFKQLIDDIPSIKDCGFIVNTGSGNGSQHWFFKIDSSLSLSQIHHKYKGIDFKSSGFVVGAGSIHASGSKYDVAIGSPSDITDAPQELIDCLAKQDKRRVVINDRQVDISNDEVRDMVFSIDPDCDYDKWVRVGMAVHHVTSGDGFKIWDEWSSGGEKYRPKEMDQKWHSFGKKINPVGLGTLVYFAEEAGYITPVTFKPEDADPEPNRDGLPCDIDSIDLLRPIGLVGDVVEWINDQCRYPRENLAVGSALTAVGNIIGMKYTDGYSGVSANLFTFCVAASGTGKEAILQASSEIMRTAGIAGACHGTIKSEQEITRNLIHHQAAIYTIDEIGLLLQKIDNATTRGGATYLEGVIGMLMSAYSKADSFLPLSGDVRRDAQKEMIRELSQCENKIAENEDKSGRYALRKEQLDRALEYIDSGLERPFLSLVGYTTPSTFEGLVTASSITSGFIGRSILVNERESNPRAKRRFKKRAMPSELASTLKSLYSAGYYDANAGGRIEFTNDKIEVPSTEQAETLLDKILDWIEDYAEQHKEMSGLEAAIRRGFELVLKISMILATPSGLREAEHVRWAFAFIYRDINDKTMMAYANENKDNKNESGKVLMARILGQIDNKTGATVAALKNRLRKKESDITKALELMEQSGKVERRTVSSKKYKKETKKWFTV